MGDSHIFTGLDAAVLSSAYDVEIDAIGGDSSNMQCVMEQFRIIVRNEESKIILLEAYNVMHDTRERLMYNYRGLLVGLYGDLSSESYIYFQF